MGGERGRAEQAHARVLHMPALALATDLDRGIYPDPLGRDPGEPLSHPKIKDGDTRALAKYWAGEKANRIASDWDAMYLTIPFASDGALLTDDDMKNAIVERAPATVRTIVSVDPSGEGRDEAGIVALPIIAILGLSWGATDLPPRMREAAWAAILTGGIVLAVFVLAVAYVVFAKKGREEPSSRVMWASP